MNKGDVMSSESGQATAEYALVIVAAAVVALALISWASGSSALPDFFSSIIERVRGMAGV
jgi:Flp pilus assembly pilin Flp